MPPRREPTVIVARRARPGREREFERWIRRLVDRAAVAPGVVDIELQPPDAIHPGEWVVVYRFEDRARLEAWLRSPVRQALIASGNDLVDGDAREQVVALSPASDRVTAVSSVRVKPGEADAFRALHAEVLQAMARAPGFLRCDLFEPVEDVQDDTVVVLAFDSRQHLDDWLRSDVRHGLLERMEQHTEGDRTVNVVGGFAGWFSQLGGVQVKRWKTALVVLAAIAPTSMAYALVRVALFPDAPVVPATLVGNVIGVALLTWVLMPFLTARLDRWLRR